MSAPRTNVAIAERMDEWREKKATQESFSANDIAFCREVSAALRKEPPALPAEVEAVLAELLENCQCLQRPTFADPPCAMCKGEALLRRYAQAVAEKDAEIARLTEEMAGPCPCDVHACLSAVAKRDKKLQAVEALEAHWGECAANTMLSAWAASADLRKILREEH